jgi:hypothetical protein
LEIQFKMPLLLPMQPSSTRDSICEWILTCFTDVYNLRPQYNGDGVTKALYFYDPLHNL